MVKLNNSQLVGRGTLALAVTLLEMKGGDSTYADKQNREDIIQQALRRELVLHHLHSRGDTLCVLSQDGRVTPVNLGDVCQLGPYNDWSNWIDDDEDIDWPTVPTIRIVQHADRDRGFYCVIYELHGFNRFMHLSSGHDLTDFTEALYPGLQENLSVNNMTAEPDFVVVISELGTTPEDAAAMVEHCLHEIQAVLVLEKDNHHDVVRVDEQDFANPDNAIGFIDPSWSAEDLVTAVRDGRI